MKIAQLQHDKPNIPDWLLYLLVIILLTLLASGFTGCNPISKATQQVMTNTDAFNKVGAVWAKLNPCVVDSNKTLVHDTTFKTDTAYKLIQSGIDANAAQQPKDVHNMKSFYKTNGSDTVTQIITNTITVHDSVKIVSVDKRVLGLYADSINYYKLIFANYKADTGKQLSNLQHTATTRLWLIIGVITAMVVYIFRKPLLTTVTNGVSLLTKII